MSKKKRRKALPSFPRWSYKTLVVDFENRTVTFDGRTLHMDVVPGANGLSIPIPWCDP